MDKFVALLRGINVGGHKRVPMKELKLTLEKNGFQNVKTLLASGNVVFDGKEEKLNDIPDILENTFGFEIPTIILSFNTIKRILEEDPFSSVKMTPKIRLYVTFLKEKPETKLKTPWKSNDSSFRIIKVTDIAVYSVLDLEKAGTIEAMNILDKQFGKNTNTTRNYNSVLKIAGM